MTMRMIQKLPQSELEVMQVIWALSAPVPRAVLEEEVYKVHPMAQTTLLTLVSRLVKKGFIKTEKNGRSSEYTPLVLKDEYIAMESKSFIQKVCGGSVSVFASGLIDSGISKEDLEELRKLLQKAEM